MSTDTKPTDAKGELKFTPEGREIVETLRGYDEGDRITIETDERTIDARVTKTEDSADCYRIVLDPTNPRQARDYLMWSNESIDRVKVPILAEAGENGWHVLATLSGLIEDGGGTSRNLGRVRSVSRPED